MSDIPTVLKDDGYNHFGDLDFYSGLLLIATEGKIASQKGYPPIVSVFEAVSLRYLGHLQLTRQRKAGWCAVRPLDNRLYSSDSTVDRQFPVYAYNVDWDYVMNSNLPLSPGRTTGVNKGNIQLVPNAELILRDENGNILTLNSMQGGVFSANDHLYTMNGYCQGSTKDTGIMGFDLSSGRRYIRSTNGKGDFNFEYHTGSKFCKEEPEGITIWDLSEFRDSKSEIKIDFKGQLHVIMIDNYDVDGPDDFYFKHYEVNAPDKL